MIIRTGAMRVVGILLLLAVGIDALALNWNRPSVNVCQTIEQTNAQLGQTAIPAGCGPVNYTLALVLGVRPGLA